jgi:hypothetical protein
MQPTKVDGWNLIDTRFNLPREPTMRLLRNISVFTNSLAAWRLVPHPICTIEVTPDGGCQGWIIRAGLFADVYTHLV